MLPILSNPQENPAAVYIASLGTPSGRRSQAQALRAISQILQTDLGLVNWAALRYQHTAMIRAQLAQHYAPATANKILSALRQTLKQAWLLGQMTAEDYRRATELEPITGETLPAGRELSQDEIRALMDACRNDPSPAGIRDAALIAVLYTTGMRREEVVKLNLSDLDNGQLKVTGKRHKQRMAYITNGALDALNSWLSVRGSSPGALFLALDKIGSIHEGNLNPGAIYKMLRKRAKEAGVKEFSPHDLRRTNATHLLQAGADIALVADLLGHANVQTTRRYDKRGEVDKRKAAELLVV